MKKIPLTRGQFATVDDWWYEYLMQWKWNALWNKNTQSFYAVRTDGKRPNRRAIVMASVVAKTPIDMIADHINHDTLLNTEENLRNVTHSQNMINTRIRKDNTTGVKGVIRSTYNGKYMAYLDFQGNRVFNKTYPTIEEAAAARKEAEDKYFGEFRYKG